MLRVVLLTLLALVIARALWRLLDGVVDGVTGRSRRGDRAPARGIQMMRDPVCGAFVVPGRAVALDDNRGRAHGRLYFCSARCRDAYRARTA
jgi:hypothetical protein